MNLIIASQVIKILARAKIRTRLIGSVKRIGFSENDVDLVLLDYPVIDSELISRICCLFFIRIYTVTNWGGVLLETTDYGNIDLFPGAFMQKCVACKKKCCI